MKKMEYPRKLWKKYKTVFLIFLLVAGLFYLITTFRLQSAVQNIPWNFPIFNKNVINSSEQNNEYDSSSEDFSEFIVDTPACRLLKTKLWPTYYTEDTTWREIRVPNCSKYSELATLMDNDSFLQINSSIPPHTCSVKGVKRNPDSDSKFLFFKERNVNDTLVPVSDLELMMINCGKMKSGAARIPLKVQVVKKMSYWKQRLNKPINVLILGFDSTSRLHMLRGFPKTMELLNQLNFLRFEGYHIIEPQTTPNLLAMLMGLTTRQVRGSCSPNWDTPFDQCPLILKNFSALNYVTAYIEDGNGAFNWGGQGGFTIDPTDYYLHTLFKAIIADRDDLDVNINCISSESIPTFMIRYLRRFLDKFRSTPFFVFEFLANPFHDSSNAIPSFDKDLAEFFRFLKSEKTLLENTLIILMSDHGDRYNFFSYDSMESYVERALPGLFLRIPDRLLEKYPEFKEAAAINTHRLTTAFDVHHTLLHILSLSGLPTSDETKFQRRLKDRSSLFVEVPESRTCDSVNVGDGYCICNVTLNGKSIDNTFFLNQLVTFGIKKLNTIVQQSKYFNVCQEWERVQNSLDSANLVSETDGVMNILLKFTANPGVSGFFAVLGVTTNSTSGENLIDLHGKFSRTDKYGNQSFCVGYETDSDKTMKELCYCK